MSQLTRQAASGLPRILKPRGSLRFKSVPNFPWRIFSRLILIQTLMVLLALAASGVTARIFFKRQFLGQMQTQLADTLVSLSKDIPADIRDSWCASHAERTSIHLALISNTGKVLCNSRPEVQIASLPVSSGVHGTTLQATQEIPSRHIVLYGAVALTELTRTLRLFDSTLVFFLIFTGLVLSAFSVWSGRRLVFPIGRLLAKVDSILKQEKGTQSVEFGEDPYGEWSEIESSLEDIRRDLETKVESLTVEREEQAILMSAISDAILAVDVEGKPLFFNTRFALLFGSGELQQRKSLWELFRDPEVLSAFQDALKEGKSTSIRGLPFEQSTGRLFLSVSISPLRRGGEAIYGAVGVFHDVTDLKRAEQIRIDFVANVSHELRTPLTAIKGYADTAIDDQRNARPASVEFLEIIVRNTDRLMNLINDLLDLSSIESTDVLHKDNISTEDFSQRVISQMQSMFEAKHQRVELSANAASVVADPKRLEQVLVNLLSNANKYTPAHGHIQILWELSGVPGERQVLLKVRDSGPGIPAEHQPRLFERFFRVDKARSREEGGTGLGLAIVKHIMQRHDGTVWVESTPGHGSCFICRFPIA